MITVRVARLGVSGTIDNGFDKSQSMSNPLQPGTMMIFPGLKSRCKIPAS
jgi:hypothetical protein